MKLAAGITAALARNLAAGAALASVLAGCSLAAHAGIAKGSAVSPASSTRTAQAVRALRPLKCVARATRRHPADGAVVGLRVGTAPHARIRVIARFEFTTGRLAARAGAGGRRVVWLRVHQAAPGNRVTAVVRVYRRGRKGSCQTWFRPRRRRAPRPSASPVVTRNPPPGPTPKPTSGAWCRATASVYNAARDWNNVYVNSDEPDQDATASADGYSWSYETDSSGYALIYLNGPPPGAQITVTVGGATCYTSD